MRKPKPENVAIGQVLKAARERHGETQEEVAQYIGVERPTVGFYESGRNRTPYEIREKLANRYGIPRAKLGLETEDTPTGPDPYEAAVALALHVIRSVDDERARELAADFLQARLVTKSN